MHRRKKVPYRYHTLLPY